MRLDLDELLARMIDAAESRGLKWTKGIPYSSGEFYDPDTASRCCAIGALALALEPNRAEFDTAYRIVSDFLASQGIVVGTACIYAGNDGCAEGPIHDPDACDLFSLGRAYREAMHP